MHVADHHEVEELDGLVRAERDGKARDRIRVVATDRAGNRRTVTRSFARCAAAIPRFTG